MAYTDHRTLRRVLRREIAGTIGLLTDEHDFRAMRRYRSFTFADQRTGKKRDKRCIKHALCENTAKQVR